MQGHNIVISPMLGTVRNYDGTTYGAQLFGDTASFIIPRGLLIEATLTANGDTYLGTGDAAKPAHDHNLYLDTNSAYATVHFRRQARPSARSRPMTATAASITSPHREAGNISIT
jgi:hypothetical protein